MSFTLALLAVVVAQTTLIPWVGIAWLFDLFMIMALAVALLAPLHDARIGAWLTGLVCGLAGLSPLGVHAFALGVAAVIVTNLRETLNVDVWWGRLTILWLGAWPAQLLVRTHLRYWETQQGESAAWLILAAASGALAAAAWATVVTGLPGFSARRRRELRSLGARR